MNRFQVPFEVCVKKARVSSLMCSYNAINGIPAGLEGVNPVRLVVEMVDTAAENTVSIKEDIDESLALSMARNAAIPQGQVLSNIEMENIVNSLFLCKNPNVTPDGKTILCILKQSEIEHLLG